MRSLRLVERPFQPYAVGLDGAGPRLRVAIASRDGRALDAHFGFASRLLVYDVGAHSHRLVQAILCPAQDDEGPSHGHAREDDKIEARVAALAGCHLLFVLAIGPPAAARVIQADIFPIKVDGPRTIESVIEQVQGLLREEPPRWLQSVLRRARETTVHQGARRKS